MGGTPSPSNNTSTGPMFFPGCTPVTGPRSLPAGVPGGGYPSPRWGTPSQPGQEGVLPWPGMRYPMSGQDGVPTLRDRLCLDMLCRGRYASCGFQHDCLVLCFVAPPHERTDLSGHYGVCAYGCLLACSWPPAPRQKKTKWDTACLAWYIFISSLLFICSSHFHLCSSHISSLPLTFHLFISLFISFSHLSSLFNCSELNINLHIHLPSWTSLQTKAYQGSGHQWIKGRCFHCLRAVVPLLPPAYVIRREVVCPRGWGGGLPPLVLLVLSGGGV